MIVQFLKGKYTEQTEYLRCLEPNIKIFRFERETGYYENLIKMQSAKVLGGGIRQYDMAIRLKYAGFDTGRFHVCDDFDGLLYTVRTNITGRLYLFATYTAMTSFRRFLHKKKYIKNVWK